MVALLLMTVMIMMMMTMLLSGGGAFAFLPLVSMVCLTILSRPGPKHTMVQTVFAADTASDKTGLAPAVRPAWF